MDLHQRTTRVTERVERAGFDQRLNRALVRNLNRHLLKKIVERRESSFRLARRRDCFDHVVPDVAHRAKAESDVADCPICSNRGEVHPRLIHVGRKHLDAHPAALTQVHAELVF